MKKLIIEQREGKNIEPKYERKIIMKNYSETIEIINEAINKNQNE